MFYRLLTHQPSIFHFLTSRSFWLLFQLQLTSGIASAKANNMSELKFPFHLAELKALDETIMKLSELNPLALFSFFSALYTAYAFLGTVKHMKRSFKSK